MCHPVSLPCPLGLADKEKKSSGVAAEEKPFPKYPVQFAAFIGPLIAIEREGEGVGFGFSPPPAKVHGVRWGKGRAAKAGAIYLLKSQHSYYHCR